MKAPAILKQVFDRHGDIASSSFELSGAYCQWDDSMHNIIKAAARPGEAGGPAA
ncbi:phage late control D family protein [Aquabacterium sp. A7-Y]|uniref:hypothetical protein n=1 Tax=Aquabacterium sp. A7-Y TaxID=1349605 RepID=UPI00223E1F87|nr:hypothetical protein [Aquabacterium sp. A7-Y]MCW7538648.1 phage late control D family protein [Aquabacterium sp. A7-Y]